jgi:gluconolactonase
LNDEKKSRGKRPTQAKTRLEWATRLCGNRKKAKTKAKTRNAAFSAHVASAFGERTRGSHAEEYPPECSRLPPSGYNASEFQETSFVARKFSPILLVIASAASALAWHCMAGKFTGGVLAATQSPSAEVGSPAAVPLNVEKLDPALDRIVPANATLIRAATGYGFTEGPVWVPRGALFFVDIQGNTIDELDPDGKTQVFFHADPDKGMASHGPRKLVVNGMTLDPQGRLTVAGYSDRNVWRLETLDPNGQKTILADSYQGKRLNSPNDTVYRSDGSLYFTDPPYGLPGADKSPEKELQVDGVFRVPGAAAQKPGSEPDRARIQLVVSDLPRPNGIAFSPDEKYLYVNNSEPNKIWVRYRVKSDGTLADAKIFCDATSDPRKGNPDGMKVDREGNIYSAGPGGVWIFSPDGKHLGTIPVPETVGNVAWGGADYKTLYITATHSVYSVALKIPGIRPGPVTGRR